MQISLGIVVQNLKSQSPILEFLQNASKFGHSVHSVIIGYTNSCNPKVVHSLEEYAYIHPVPLNRNNLLYQSLKNLDMQNDSIDELLFSEPLDKTGSTPYGFTRNAIVMEAMLLGSDVLFFVDYDVYPYVLRNNGQGIVLQEVDFFGNHLKGLVKGAVISTGGYSGYNTLPPASFKGMEDILLAVQREEESDYWRNSYLHGGLVTQNTFLREPKPTDKVTGGNMAISLSGFQNMKPFFTPYYFVNDILYSSRGEDKFIAIHNAKKLFLDIGMPIFHNTYHSYPQKPNLQNDPRVQQRFFVSCTGWIGRNPFYNWLKGEDIKLMRERQMFHLQKGLPGLIRYTKNPVYKTLTDALDTSYNNLDTTIVQYKKLCEAWGEFLYRVKRGSYRRIH